MSIVNCQFLQAGVNVCGYIPDVLLQIFVTGVEGVGDFIDGVEDRGVIPVKLLADIRSRKVGQLSDEVNGNLPGLCRAFVL